MFADLFLFGHLLLFGFLLTKLLLKIHDHFCLLSLELNHFLDVSMNRGLLAHFTLVLAGFQCILRLHSVFIGLLRRWNASLVNTFAQTKINRLIFIRNRRFVDPLFLVLHKWPLVVVLKFSRIMMVGISRFGHTVNLMPVFVAAFILLHLRLVGVIHGVVIWTLPITVITGCFEALVQWQMLSLTVATVPWTIIYLLGKFGLEVAVVCLSWWMVTSIWRRTSCWVGIWSRIWAWSSVAFVHGVLDALSHSLVKCGGVIFSFILLSYDFVAFSETKLLNPLLFIASVHPKKWFVKIIWSACIMVRNFLHRRLVLRMVLLNEHTASHDVLILIAAVVYDEIRCRKVLPHQMVAHRVHLMDL